MIQEKLLTRKEVAEFLRVDLSTLWRWEKKHPDYLTPIRVGKSVRYKESDLKKIL